ncbi:MAG: amidase [Acidimicrobiia bacterium]|nr:amidase [Actinomycetota bacterium]MBL6923933.1 amidase [Acidimicrobiia bacterium]MBL6926068.1 amidase [Acidimicrobiia bacterium]
MDPVDLPAVEQFRLMEAGALSAGELLEACSKRASITEPVVNALVAVDWNKAAELATALDSDRSLCRGAPLRGLVTAHKDLLDTAGVPTTYGSTVYARHVPETDNPLVALLHRAGVVPVGKTNTPEFGAGSHTFNSVYGVTRNPWNPGLTAGGSSGGAAAALACGSLSIADGSDLGGSLRNPASFCGIVGFRPSAGRVPGNTGADPRITMPTNGPMGRTVADVGLLFGAMTGHLEPPVQVDPPRALLSLDHGDLPVDPAVRRLVEDAAGTLEEEGWQIQSGDLSLAGADACFETLRSLAYSLMHPDLVDDGRVKATVRGEIVRGMSLHPDDVDSALVTEARIRQLWRRIFDDHDVVITPTSQVPPFPVGQEWVTEIEGVHLPNYTDWMRSCSRLTVTGAPSVSLPAGFTGDGLPVGVQLSCRRGSDAYLLAVAEAAEMCMGVDSQPPIEAIAAISPDDLPPGPPA